jgi:voltage-gated potassium channel
MATQPTPANAPYLLFSLILSLLGILILGISVAVPLKPDARLILDYADDGLCTLFFCDFLVSLWKAPNRWTYFIRWGWIDLLSSVPYVDYFRVGRVARVFRIFRVLRAIKSAKVLAELILRRRSQSAMLATTLIGVLLVILASITILHFEDVAGANILSAEDALWWTMETITTVGYGDKYPVTSEGRILASAVMIMGVGLTAIYTGAVAAWFLKPAEMDASVPAD